MQIKVYKSYDITGLKIDVHKVAAEIKQLLDPCYGNPLICNGDTIRINGNLASFWERAITNVEIRIKIQGEEMFISAEGKCSLGASPWVWFWLGLLLLHILLIWFALDLIEYFLSRKLPEKYINDVLESIEFKLRENPEKYMLIPKTGEQNPNIKKENES